MIDFARFSESGRRAMLAAQVEAHMLGRGVVDAEHLLLGVLADPGAAVSVLRGVTLIAARKEIVSMRGQGADSADDKQSDYTPRSEMILEQSMREAQALKQDHVRVEHILLALMGECGGAAANVLNRMGLDTDRAREELLRICENEAQGDAPGSGGYSAPDWKKPLYDYAVNLEKKWVFSKLDELREIYSLLKGYQDADERLKGILAKAQSEYERVANTVCTSENPGEIESALRNLQDMKGYGDSAAMIARGEERLKAIQERERAEKEARELAEKRKKRRLRAIVAAAAVLVVGVIVFYNQVIVPGYVRKGDEALASGKYEDAIALYEKVGAKDQIREANIAWGGEMLESGSYADAVALYEKAGAQDQILEATIAWGEEMLEEGDYEGAVEKFEELDIEDSAYNAYRAWSDHLADTGNAAEAVEKLRNVPESPEREARIAELQLQQADESLAMLDKHSNGTQDNRYARQLGEPITDLNAQLRYCHGLSSAGYDLSSVYPDGVNVVNAPLGKYQIEDIAENDIEAIDLDPSRMLLFERTEKPFEDYDDYLPDLAPRDHYDDALYNVKLLPGQLFQLRESSVAESWEDASCIMLLDNIYMQSGTITQTTTRTGGSYLLRTTDREEYPFYSAVSSICAFDKDAPGNGVIMSGTSVDPTCADDTWFNLRKETNDVLEAEHRVAAFDNEAMHEALDTYLLFLLLL